MRYLLLLLLLPFLACQSRQSATTTTAQKTDTVAADLTRKPALDAPRHAADRLVRMLYFEHDKTENPFLKAPDRRLADQFFAPSLAEKVWATARKTAKRPARNPLYNVPDAGVKKMWVLPANVSGNRAVVFVTFNSGNVPAEMRAELTLQPSGRWRITDLVYADGSRLSAR